MLLNVAMICELRVEHWHICYTEGNWKGVYRYPFIWNTLYLDSIWERDVGTSQVRSSCVEAILFTLQTCPWCIVNLLTILHIIHVIRMFTKLIECSCWKHILTCHLSMLTNVPDYEQACWIYVQVANYTAWESDWRKEPQPTARTHGLRSNAEFQPGKPPSWPHFLSPIAINIVEFI